MTTGGAAQTWFVVGAIPLLLAGGLHALLTLIDTVRPTFFAPVDPSVVRSAEGTGVRFVRMFGGGERSSMWSMWLGMHVSHGLGAFTFALILLLVATHDFALIGDVGGLRAVTIVVPALYCALSLRFWFYLPSLVTGAATACFAISALTA